MNDVISEYKSGVTPKDKNQREIINKISNTEKSIHRKYNNSTGDFNNELKIIPTRAIFYFYRAILRTRNGDLDGARADFKMSEKLDRDLNGDFSDYPVF